jgi:hypothetical protein
MANISGNTINAWCAESVGNAVVMDPTVSHREDLIATQECFVGVVQEIRVVLNVVVVEHVLEKREILVVPLQL